ncbi:hydroxymethylglutaryl-CoA synthase [Fonticula alba]|uniref:Hydroxymethylglutaryl-CoA synthase n=1 Tax=Fonticula alba TaxID=691883 RepID=A0A058ZFD3_FONAL|nr:hydroxymethylglutaryl-CoA synthase [Fonticula alba]KCV73095.1 hydroxymethylglutaryl-CoA synthase [Fonticula alba]|eukprot:XP_009492796.1 hydroxymethylglutaryl-CoA synthase [Fonticula alba]
MSTSASSDTLQQGQPIDQNAATAPVSPSFSADVSPSPSADVSPSLTPEMCGSSVSTSPVTSFASEAMVFVNPDTSREPAVPLPPALSNIGTPFDASAGRPKDIGILAMEVYFPQSFVEQSDLEEFDNVSSGKYTIGLGQSRMAVVDDNEDINSICLTAVSRLMMRTRLPYSAIGRLEVGTETIIDKSKATKTVLMQLFANSGNTDVEGIDTTNACYGGTAALFNTVAWMEGSSWCGRYGIVVAADIAVYGTKAARPTGGCAAIAMLVGPNAPVYLEPGLRSSHFEHVYDFYKPDFSSEYPAVDGRLSATCFTRALDTCYRRLQERGAALRPNETPVDTGSLDYLVFHSPYLKLVRKSVSRLAYLDYVAAAAKSPELAATRFPQVSAELQQLVAESTPETNRDCAALEAGFRKVSSGLWSDKVSPATLIAKNVGNSYTASAYASLASVLASEPLDKLAGARLMVFSYGSGLASSMFCLRVRGPAIPVGLEDLAARLNARTAVSPQHFTDALSRREAAHGAASFSPVASHQDTIAPSTFFLSHINDRHHRAYAYKRADGTVVPSVASS